MRKGRGFTLIELIVILAIVTLVALMLLPVPTVDPERVCQINCAGNMKQIGLALRMYATDSTETFPPADNAPGLNLLARRGYLTAMEVYLCPSTKAKPGGTEILDNLHLDYIYKGGYSERDCSQATGLACDRILTPNHKDFGNVLFGDGHVKGFAGPAWALKDHTHNTGGWPPDPH
ncbi:MAG: hypothetical protein A3K19_20910 [Lentisphaerae bacterium RIFOXYB12_FULL_65_16]|nr:MAG: hypothetical protein A3K18_19335 [Lentisphaerae bacterium RIFOXYA12_64_32]OGV85195.1 MAG: hypothetical protein A3K19_20910 [Lentisphaerae bacterium RIFOXYB12_FULL_65_16]